MLGAGFPLSRGSPAPHVLRLEACGSGVNLAVSAALGCRYIPQLPAAEDATEPTAPPSVAALGQHYFKLRFVRLVLLHFVVVVCFVLF